MTTFKQKLGCYLHERWRTEFVLNFSQLTKRFGYQWLDLCNRHERLAKGENGARICLWQDSSFLTVARFFPRVGGRLLRHCLLEWPLQLKRDSKFSKFNGSPKMSVILPVSGKDRVPAFRCVLRSFLGQTCNDLEIIIVEHGHKAVFKSECPDGTNYIFSPMEAEQQFNKSMAMNEGVRNAKAPYVLLHDADVIPPRTYVENIIHHLKSGWEAVRPMRFIFHFDPADTESFINSDARYLPEAVEFVQQNFPGISTALRKDAYEQIGGHDERFWGWGGEDSEFLDRIKAIKLYPGSYAPGIHLWHSPAPKKASGNRNKELTRLLACIPTTDRGKILQKLYSNKQDLIKK